MSHLTRIHIVLLLLSTGCTLTQKQKAAVSDFAVPSKMVSDFVSAELPKMRARVIETSHGIVEMSGLTASTPTDGPGTDVYFKDPDQNLDEDKIANAMAAAKALFSYASALKALSEETQEKELGEAADQLKSSIKAFQSASGQTAIRDDQLDALGELIKEAGGWWIEVEKTKAIKELVPKARPLVTKLVAALKQSFSPDPGAGFASDVKRLSDVLAVAAHTHIKDATTTDARRRGANLYKLAQENIQAVDKVYKELVNVLDALGKANTELGTLLGNGEISQKDIVTYQKQAKSIVNHIEILLSQETERKEN